MRMEIDSFVVGSRTYRFKKPLMFEDESTKELLFFSNAELRIIVYGSSLDECEAGIREELEMLWEEYALASDNELSKDAIKLKERLLGMVEEDE